MVIGTMTNDFTEFATDTDLLFLIGTNTSECHPIIAMQMLRGLDQGAKIIVIDPKKTDMAKEMLSCNSSLASSAPATSSKVTFRDDSA